MRLEDHLNDKQKKQLNKIRVSLPKPKNKKKNKDNNKSSTAKKKEEKVDWVDIMGMNRDTYRRGKGGAMRRK